MELEIQSTALCILMLLAVKRRKRLRGNRWINRQWAVRPINRLRNILAESNHLVYELRADPKMFHRRFRMDVPTYDKLLDMLRPRLEKRHPAAIPPRQRLNVALRYLFTGDEISSIALAERMGESTVRGIIKEVCTAIIDVLQPIYLRKPNEAEWRQIAADFHQFWNLPNCVGAIDGKHFMIEAPDNSGSEYFNYQRYYSQVLLAVCDARYIFTMVQVGEMGSNSDAGIFGDSELGKMIINNQADFPRGQAYLPGSQIRTPCYIVGDDAFPLKENLMKPYPGQNLNEAERIFNYRLSRARRIIENTFGILTARFRVFKKCISFQPGTVDKIMFAAICLHNFLRIEEETKHPHERIYCPPRFADWNDASGHARDGQWRHMPQREGEIVQMVDILPHANDVNVPRNAAAMRDSLRDYFLTPEGQVPWQSDRVRFPGAFGDNEN